MHIDIFEPLFTLFFLCLILLLLLFSQRGPSPFLKGLEGTEYIHLHSHLAVPYGVLIKVHQATRIDHRYIHRHTHTHARAHKTLSDDQQQIHSEHALKKKMPKTSSSGEKARLRAGPASDPPPTSLTPTTNNHVGADHDGSNSQHLLHPQQQQQHPNDLPPSYDVINPPLPSIPTTTTISSSSLPILSQNPLDAISRLTSIDLPKYCGVSQAKLSASHDALTTTKPELSTTQYALMRFLNEQASLPPKPLMLIQGSHTTSNGTTQVDFDITLNLTSLLDLDVPSTNGTAPSSTTATTTTAATTRLQVDPFESSSPTTSSSSTSHFKRSSRGNNQSMTPLEQWVKKFIDEKTENKRYVCCVFL